VLKIVSFDDVVV